MSAANAPNLHILKIRCLQLCLQPVQSGQQKMDKHSLERKCAVNLKQTFSKICCKNEKRKTKCRTNCNGSPLIMEMYGMRQTAQVSYDELLLCQLISQATFF